MNNIQQCSVTALACSVNWSLVAAGRTIEVSTPDGVPLYKYCGHEGLIGSVAFAPNGCVVASAGADTTVQVWDVVTGKVSQIYTGHNTQSPATRTPVYQLKKKLVKALYGIDIVEVE